MDVIARPVAYAIEKLGRPALFLLPANLMGQVLQTGLTCEEEVRQFLESRYQGFTIEDRGSEGHWVDSDGRKFQGVNRRYRVSFVGKERIPELAEFLAYLAVELGQKSIYLETGEEAQLIRPTRTEGG